MLSFVKTVKINDRHISYGIAGIVTVAVLIVIAVLIILLSGGKLEYKDFKLSASTDPTDKNETGVPKDEVRLTTVSTKTIAGIPSHVQYIVLARGKKEDAIVMAGTANFATANGELIIENGIRDTVCIDGKIVRYDSPDATWASDGIGIVNEHQILVHANTATENGILRSDFRLTISRDDNDHIASKLSGPITFFDGTNKRQRELIIEFYPNTKEHKSIIREGSPCTVF